MQIEHIEKIRQLVKASRLLNESERLEWLWLIDLMNNKQLLELERILSAAAAKAAVPLPVPAPIKPPLPQQAHLTHILNIPAARPVSAPSPARQSLADKGGNGGPISDADFAISKAGEREKQRVSGFMQKIKGMLAEKELTDGKVGSSPRLPEHGTPDKPAEQFPKPTDGHTTFMVLKAPPPPKPPEDAPHKPVVAAPMAHPIPVPSASSAGISVVADKVSIFNYENPGVQQKTPDVTDGGDNGNSIKPEPAVLPKKEEQFKVVVNQPATVLEKTETVIQAVPVSGDASKSRELPAMSRVLVKPVAENTAQTEVMPGTEQEDVHAPAESTKQKSPTGKLKAEKQEEEEEPKLVIGPVELKKTHGAPVGMIKTVEDVAKIELKIWTGAIGSELFERLKTLMLQYGYHDLMFSFEKSPLYKSYIVTGAKILDKKISFSESQSAESNMLSREDFEDITDLLQKLRSAL